MNLTIDIGNTRAKIILFEDNQPIYEEVVDEGLITAVDRIFEHYHPEKCIWCNVGTPNKELENQLSTLPCPVTHLTGTTEVPLTVCYKSRQTLGADRLAAVLGAVTLCPGTDLLVIDAGTCITYDFVDAQGNYRGGNISPGLEMRLKALHHFTARLPKVEENGEMPEMGVNTETAIRCGVVNGLTYEIEGYINHYQNSYPNLRTFLTGGSKFNITTQANKKLLSDPYLVARGMNSLL